MRDADTTKERRVVAETACSRLHIDFPAVVDEMDDRASRAYSALPDRIYVIRANGTVGFRSGPGPEGFDPDALAHYLRRTAGPPAALQPPAADAHPAPTLAVGQPAPDIEGASIGGMHASLAAMRGKVVLVDFWATWCPSCRAALPALQRLYGRYNSEGLEMLGISLDGPTAGTGAESVRRLMTKMAIPWPQLYDGRAFEGAAARKYGIESPPTLVLVGADGRIRSVFVGAPSDEALARAVSAALWERPAPESPSKPAVSLVSRDARYAP